MKDHNMFPGDREYGCAVAGAMEGDNVREAKRMDLDQFTVMLSSVSIMTISGIPKAIAAPAIQSCNRLPGQQLV